MLCSGAFDFLVSVVFSGLQAAHFIMLGCGSLHLRIVTVRPIGIIIVTVGPMRIRNVDVRQIDGYE